MMYPPILATPLSAVATLSLFLLGFSATASAQNPNSFFTKFNEGIEIPPALVQCPGQRPMPLQQILAQRAQGRALLLHLWAPFCVSCHSEMRQIDDVKPLLERESIVVYPLAQDPHGSYTVSSFAQRHGIVNLDLCFDQASAALMALHPTGLPVTYVVSPTGRITGVHEGNMDWLGFIASGAQREVLQ